MRTTRLSLLGLALLLGALATAPAKAMPRTGNGKAVVLCAEPYDLQHGEEYDTAYFRDMLFQLGYPQGSPRGSMRDYFRECSYYNYYKNTGTAGTPRQQWLDISGDAWGWFIHPDYPEDPENDPDENSTDWFNGLQDGVQGPPRLDDFVIKTIQAADDPFGLNLNFSQYDGNSDGMIDTVIIVHPGGDLNLFFWGALPFPLGPWDGVWLRYLIVLPQDSPMLLFARGMGAVLRLDDLYDYPEGTMLPDPNSGGAGIYDLMSTGSCQLGAYSKRLLRWYDDDPTDGQPNNLIRRITQADIRAAPGKRIEVSLRPSAIYPDVVEFEAGGGQYFLVENRQRIGFDVALPGQGIQIWHVDPAMRNNELEWWPEIGDATETPHLKVAVEQADGLWEIEKRINPGNAADFFGITPATSKFTNNTRPSSRGYGQPQALISIASMVRTGDDFTLTFKLPTYNITGFVDRGGSPLAGVRIEIADQVGNVIREVYTGPDGTYNVTDLDEEVYRVTPSLIEHDFAPVFRQVTIGPTATNVNFTGTQRTYTITSTVTHGGAPMENVEIAIGEQTALTDATGTAVIVGLKAGTYAVIPSLAGYVFTPALQSVEVNTALGDGTATFTASSMHQLAGVITADGLPLQGVTVTADDGAGNTKSTLSNGSGHYLLSGLAEGTYTVTPSKAEFTFTPGTRNVTLNPATPDPDDADFVGVRATYRISGTVTSGGAPLPGVTVVVGGTPVVTGADGTYAVAGLFAGGYKVTPSLAGYTFNPTARDVTVGPDRANVNFVGTPAPVPPTYVISGTVTEAGVGLPGVRVTAGTEETVTDAMGNYALVGLAPDVYTVLPSLTEYTFVPLQRQVTVSDANVGGVDFVATRGTYTISGRVALDGVGLPGVIVSAAGRQVVTGSDGSYTVGGVVAGTYTVTAEAEGYSIAPAEQQVTVGPSQTNINFTASLRFTHDFPAGWSLFSLPVQTPGATAADVFGPPVTAVYRYDSAQGIYVAEAGPLQSGTGYWVNLGAPTTAAASGVLVDGDAFPVQLGMGWQLIGNPFNSRLDWPACQVPAGGGLVTVGEAAASGWMLSYAWAYTPGVGFQLVHESIPGARTQILPWEGFFVYANQPMTLILRRAGGGAAEAKANSRSSGLGTGFSVNLVARCNDAVDGYNIMGIATDGAFASGLVAAEPPIPSDGVSLSFTRPGSNQRYAVDIRSGSASAWSWEVEVRARAANSTVTVSLDDLRSLPRDLDVVITDAQTGRSVSARANAVYTFHTSDAGTPRRLTVTVQRRGQSLRIEGLTADATARGTCSIAYTLSASAEVTVRVFNLAGREVARVADNVTQAAGAQVLTWNGRSLRGTALPSGTYLIQVEASADGAERSRASTRVSLGAN